MLAGLEIAERYNHGIYFTIYPLGRDASIYSGSRDLKIKNNTNHPVYIKTFASDKKLSYKIYGTPTAKKISFSRPMIFFEGEKFIPYDIMGESGLKKINEALTSGKGFYTYIKVTQELAGFTTTKTIVSHYKLTGDRENVKVVRPEPR
jgi:vancomycin resistance protein YoaR